MAKPGITRDRIVQVAFDMIWDKGSGAVSVGDICERAGVNKGSFYHFFESKSDLIIAAHEYFWNEKRPEMDRIFSPQTPPLERLHKWCEYVYEGQRAKAGQFGHVCGCPYASVATESAGVDQRVRAHCEKLMTTGLKYFESAISDAIRAGQVTVKDPARAAQRIFSISTGVVVQAKAQNNLELLRDLEPAIMEYLGAKTAVAA